MAERMRLDRMIANMGRGSRKEVRTAVKQGRVTVNGVTAKKPDQYVMAGEDQVVYCGELVPYQKYIYLMMNKPAGYVSANEDKRDATVMELLDYPWCNIELFVAGRLDKDTTGLLILTNNGKFSHNMLAPKKHVPKTYEADISGCVTQKEVELFAQGITIDGGYQCQPAQLEILHSGECSHIRLTIHEGKFHQVKRMFEAVEMKVTTLQRISIGGLVLDETLERGEVRQLTRQEVESIGADLGEE